MCGRFNVTADPLSTLLLELMGQGHPGPDNFNAAPTETIVVGRLADDGSPELVAMRWWLTPFWAREMSTRYSMFNAKSENVHQSPAFREPFRSRRCVVPVSGFYEWARTSGQKLPYYIHPHGLPGLLLAGIWDSWRNPQSNEILESFAVLTEPANPALAFVHSRQPVMLSLAEAHHWLDKHTPKDELRALMDSSLPVTLDAVPVSSYVNNARHKDARCVEAIAEPVVVPAAPASASDSTQGAAS
jgi:putative SOS response-associated peptidase YedK